MRAFTPFIEHRMCIALPCRILAIVDPAQMLVAVTTEGDSAPEVVSAVLVVTPELSVERLVGRYALIHAGFAISLIDEAEAQSRLQVFAALNGDEGDIDLDDFYAATTGTAQASR